MGRASSSLGRRLVRDEPDLNYLFSIDLSDCISPLGLSYSKGAGAHPFVQTLDQIEACPSLNWDETAVYQFLKEGRPKVWSDYLQIDDHSIDLRTFQFPLNADILSAPILPMPWSTQRTSKDYFRGNWIKTTPEKAAANHVMRLLKLKESINTNGFSPNGFRTGKVHKDFIAVTKIRSSLSERTVVLGGQHRVAVLAHLGFQYAPAIFSRRITGEPEIVDIRNVETLPIVTSRVLSPQAVVAQITWLTSPIL